MTGITRPVLRYHGGKWRIAPWIISHFPEHGTYVELFGGAASVLLRKPRSQDEVYNDIDGEVVNLFRVLRDQETATELCNLIELTPFSRTEFEESYDHAGDASPVERARKLVIKSFMGFGTSGNRGYITGFRAASKQSGRPHAKDWSNLPESLHAVTERLKGVTIECRPAIDVLRQQDRPTALFYVDPPYLPSTRPTSNKSQYLFEMTQFEHLELLKALRLIRGKAVVSGYDAPLYNDLLAGWRTDDRSVLAQGQGGSCERVERLWMNFD